MTKIYVCKKKEGAGNSVKCVGKFDSLEGFFKALRERNGDYFFHFSNDIDARVPYDRFWFNPIENIQDQEAKKKKAFDFDVLKKTRYAYVVFDENEDIIPLGTLRTLFGEWKKAEEDAWRKRSYFFRHWRAAGSKPRGGKCFRRVRTFHEKKWSNAWDDEEIVPHVRSKRKGRRLPDAWDDYPISRRDNRNWKEYRKTQWKERKDHKSYGKKN